MPLLCGRRQSHLLGHHLWLLCPLETTAASGVWLPFPWPQGGLGLSGGICQACLEGWPPDGNSFPSPTAPTVRRIPWALDLCQAWSRHGRCSRVGQARSAHGGCQPRAPQPCMVRCVGDLERHTARGNAFQTQSVIKFRDYYYCGEGSKKALSCIVGTWALL